MPISIPTQTYAVLHLITPQRTRSAAPLLTPASEIAISSRTQAPGSALPSRKILSFDPEHRHGPQRSAWDLRRDRNRFQVVADLNGSGSGGGSNVNVSFQVEFGWLHDKLKPWDLAAHLYLIPTTSASPSPSLPFDKREPIWLGGSTLPKTAGASTATISAHWIAHDRRRALSFTQLENEERTLLLTLHRINFVKSSSHFSSATSSAASTSIKKTKSNKHKSKKLKTEHFKPDPAYLLLPSAGVPRGAQDIGDGLVLKETERVTPFEAYAITYLDHREQPFVEFVFHCRSRRWIDEHVPASASAEISISTSSSQSTSPSPSPTPCRAADSTPPTSTTSRSASSTKRARASRK